MRFIAATYIAYIALIIAILWGWVLNLIDVVALASMGAPVTALFLVKIIGIPVPILGAVLGWL